MRSLLIFFVALGTLTGCWEKRIKHLSDTEFDHYYALRPFMNEDMRKTYLKLKTEEERNQYLKDLGLWERFYQYDAEVRDAIVLGAVEPGWTKDKVLMAWGAPYDKRKLTGRKAVRSELLIYRFERHEDGSILVWEQNSKTEYKATQLFRREVTLDDDIVVEIVEHKNW